MPDAVAVISDVHGNRWALEAVLEDIARRAVAQVVNLGDSVYGPLDPAGTAGLLRGLGAVSVRGNQDRALLEPDAASIGLPTFRFVNEQLTAEDLRWLGEHRMAPLRVGSLILCHGTPERDDACLVERITEHGVAIEDAGTLSRKLASLEGSAILCGHSHVPRVVGLPDGRLIVNPGSVGLPAYSADAPWPHAMEAGSPHARYAMLERTDTGWRVEHIALTYDWEEAAASAERNGRADWATWLRSGRAAA